MRIGTIDEVLKMISAAEMEEMKKVANNGSSDITNCFYSRLNQDNVFVAYVAPFAIERSISVQCAEKESNTEICFSWENARLCDMLGCEEAAEDISTNFTYKTNVTRKIKVPGIVNKKSASLVYENGLIMFKCKLEHSQSNSFELRCGKK